MSDNEHLVDIPSNSSYQAFNGHVNLEIEPPSTEETTRINADPKLLYLDGLRGILCLLVIFSHSLLMGKTKHAENFSIFFRPWMQHSPLRLLVAG